METNFRRDWTDLLSTFNAHGVDYMLVGGHAMTYLGEPRATKDLDLFVAPEPDNLARAIEALTEFGAPLWGITIEELASGSVLQIGLPPGRIDIMARIDGVSFAEARVDRLAVTFDGIPTWVIGEDAFIRNKLATGRASDREDAELLQRARDRSDDGRGR
jgi:hypothetical protein